MRACRLDVRFLSSRRRHLYTSDLHIIHQVPSNFFLRVAKYEFCTMHHSDEFQNPETARIDVGSRKDHPVGRRQDHSVSAAESSDKNKQKLQCSQVRKERKHILTSQTLIPGTIVLVSKSTASTSFKKEKLKWISCYFPRNLGFGPM
jgi:hypothetical protein